MTKTCRTYMAKILIAVLTAGLLGGCQRPPKGEGESPASSERPVSDTAGTGDTPDLKQGKEPAAMGRYRETELELPEGTESQSLICFISGEGGRMELYTAAKGGSEKSSDVFRYRYEEETWKRDEDWAGAGALRDRGLDLMNVVYGQDGNYYLGGVDGDYRYHLLKLEEDGGTEELLEEVFQPGEKKQYGLIPPGFGVTENGSILIHDYWEVYLYDSGGARLLSMTKDFSGSDSDARGFLNGNEFITVNGGNIVRYDLKDGRVTETVDYSEVDDSRESVCLFGDGSGGIYAVNEKGLSHINQGGTVWEILIDGSLNHLGMRSLYLKGFLKGEKEDFYGAFVSEGNRGITVYHYEYDPDMTAVPPLALTVYSLEDQSVVRQAVSQFQSEHPDVRVELRTAVEDGGAVTEEMIQGLNTELLSGKGADVLILDGLPAASYIEKGVLADLSDLVKDLEESGDMMDNFLEGFREEDGSIRQIPARVGFPLVTGRPEAVKAHESLESMTTYQGERPLTEPDNYENLQRKIGWLCYEELFGQEMKVRDRQVLIRYLESVKLIGEANGSQTSFTEAETLERFVTNHVVRNGITGGVVDFDRGVSDSGVEFLEGYSRLSFPAQVRRQNPGSVMAAVGKLYFPSAMAGINQAAADKDMAEEFIRCLLSFEVQKEDFYDGFPVNKKALEHLTESAARDQYSESVGYTDGYRLHADWPTLEERREILAMMENLSVPVVVDETVMKMITEGSRDYFDNKKTVDQAADGILRKLSIYLAE